ncbi:stalk domain-containing protein [Paenibacillus sp. sgz302251]|uniref:stalk domain-containing protein n=1 Tax=Paenibacillus sp. sgz302251 TaxID=3414493 RepID=UPI003C7D2D34
MILTKMLSHKALAASIATAALITAMIPAGVSYGASSNESAIIQFQVGSRVAVDHRGEHKLSAAPYIINGIAMVPVRAMAEGL